MLQKRRRSLRRLLTRSLGAACSTVSRGVGGGERAKIFRQPPTLSVSTIRRWNVLALASPSTSNTCAAGSRVLARSRHEISHFSVSGPTDGPRRAAAEVLREAPRLASPDHVYSRSSSAESSPKAWPTISTGVGRIAQSVHRSPTRPCPSDGTSGLVRRSRSTSILSCALRQQVTGRRMAPSVGRRGRSASRR